MVIPDHDLLSPAPTPKKDPQYLEDGVYGESSVMQQQTSIDGHGLSFSKKSPLQQQPSIIDQGLHSTSLSNNNSPYEEASGRIDSPHDASYAINDAVQCTDSPVIESIRCIEAPKATNGLMQTRLDYKANIPHEGTTTIAAADAISASERL